ncbi:hypothetical protein BSKO_10195 [Bryopsis sp. KO-2023]|nr:hypothetical protein BSKO_10195 [Bryopsis sp. KO-2023]
MDTSASDKENTPSNARPTRGGDPVASSSSTKLQQSTACEISSGKWLHGLELLVRKSSLVQKECSVPVSLGSTTKELLAERDASEKEWRSYRQELHADIDGVNGLVKSVAKMLENVEPGKEYVDALSKAMESIEKEVGSIKANQRKEFDELSREEQLLSRDIELMVESLNASSAHAGPGNVSSSKPHPKKPPQCSNWIPGSNGAGVLPDVLEYDEYVQTHGETKGWHLQDHKEFLRVLKVCKGSYPVAVEMCCEEMIGYTRQDILDHARWHSVLVDLANQKKVAIAAWRAEKEAEKVKRMQEAAFESKSAREALADSEQRQMVERLRREVQRQMVAEWQEAKDSEKKQKIMEQREAARLAQEEKQEELKIRQQHNKAMVQSFKEKKMAERKAAEEAMISAKAALRPTTPSSTNLDRIRQRNAAVLQKKIEREREQAEAKREQEDRLSKLKQKVHVEVPADPNRILKPTAAMVHKEKAVQEEKRIPRDSGYIRYVQHKARPSWSKPLG